MSLRRPTVACLSFTFPYKPFMWCRSDVRLWHACHLLFNISPLCDVAQTSDCGIIVILYSDKSPFCGVALTPGWGNVFYFIFTFRGVASDTRSAFFLFYWDFGRTTARLPFFISAVQFFNTCMRIINYAHVHHVLHLLYLMSKLFASTFKVLTGLSLAIVLARCWRRRSYGWRVR